MATSVLCGDLRTGRITAEVPVTGGAWKKVLDDAGDITGVTVHEEVVRRLGMRSTAAVCKTFLAVEVDDRVLQGGPVWTHAWSWASRVLTLGAGGLWSLFDHRKVLPVLIAGQRLQDADTTVAGTDLGGIARTLVAQALSHVGGSVPVVLPTLQVGTRTETFPGYSLLQLGDQLRQLTKRETAATDIRFTPRRRGDDPTFLEWVMQVGTETVPQLSQLGPDWVLDSSRPRTPVRGIDSATDGAGMGFRGYVTGSGSERLLAVATAYDPTLVEGGPGYPLLEVDESRSSVLDPTTLAGYATNLVGRRSRPVETITVTVQASAVAGWEAGDYVSLTTADDDPYFGRSERRLRIIEMTGAVTSDDVRLAMAPTLTGV